MFDDVLATLDDQSESDLSDVDLSDDDVTCVEVARKPTAAQELFNRV